MLGSSCMDTLQQEMLFTLLGLHSFEKNRTELQLHVWKNCLIKCQIKLVFKQNIVEDMID